jgi:hypothetical protein
MKNYFSILRSFFCLENFDLAVENFNLIMLLIGILLYD